MTGGKEVRENNLNSGREQKWQWVETTRKKAKVEFPQAREPVECESEGGAEMETDPEFPFLVTGQVIQ